MSDEREQTQDLSPLKRALFAIKDLRGRVDELERARTEPIAIVGMACRFPGAPDVESFWQVLANGVDAIRPVPGDRWDEASYYDSDPDAPGKTYMREGGFLSGLDQFDAEFFGVPPREAASLDPQQRLLLEVAWEALENAGIPASSLGGRRVGVVVGLGTQDFAQLMLRDGTGSTIDAYMGTGGAPCTAVGRIAYTLGLQGPAMAIDTACSSSLVAVDVAVQQLRARQCELALAGGVNAILSPTGTIYLSKVRALSPTNRCRAFDAAADGYVRGEGCGIVVLKRLSEAERDGDTVLAIIRGSATNHDGRSSGLTVPNGQAQQAVVSQALANGGVEPQQIHYVEAHGTGTPLGDPIELRALGAVLGERRDPEKPLLVGTVKTNIGHLEAAAGIAGLVKVVLAMQRGTIPASLHLRTPNPHVPWAELPIRVVSEPSSWPDDGAAPIAGISAFGFSGTNAHVIVEAYSRPSPADVTEGETKDRGSHLLTLTASSEPALRALAASYAAVCSAPGAPDAADVAFSANLGRSLFDHRLAVVGENAEQLAAGLKAVVDGREHPSVVTGQVGTDRSKIAFLFTGQGSQYPGMGRELYETEPAFRAAIDRCDEILAGELEHRLTATLFSDDPAAAARLNQTAYTQPALFAVEYALATLWRSWRIEPAYVLGHSLGEYVAACVSGVFTLEDALRLVALRARLMQALPGGRMATVSADEPAVRRALQPYQDVLSIAAVNGPGQIVISGAPDAMDAVLANLTRDGVRTQPLAVSHAFHSPSIAPMLVPFEAAVSSVQFGKPNVRLISNLTGEVATAGQLAAASYWREHARQPVLFARSIETLASLGCTSLLEIGPHPTLLGMVARSAAPAPFLSLPSLRRGTSDTQQMLKSLGMMFVNGVTPNWRALERGRPRRRVALPTYPFQRSRHWPATVGTPASAAAATVAPLEPEHSLLGQRLRSPLLKETVFQTTVSDRAPSFVRDHVVLGTPLFPATGYVEMAAAAGRTVLDRVEVQEITIEEPLPLAADAPRVLQIAVSATEGDRARFEVFSREATGSDAAEWSRHASGWVAATAADGAQRAESLEDVRRRCDVEVDRSGLYARLHAAGVEYGPTFQAIERIWAGTNEAIARLRLPAASPRLDEDTIHPGYLDAALQTLLAALPADMTADGDVYLPIALRGVRHLGPVPGQVWSHATIRRPEAGETETLTARLRWFDDDGQIVWEADSLTLKRASAEALRRQADRQLAEWLYELAWQPEEEVPAAPATMSGTWLVCSDGKGVGAALVRELGARGATCVVLEPGNGVVRNGNAITVDPSDRAGLADVIGSAIRAARDLKGVVHLWNLDTAVEETTTALDDAAATGCGSLLALVQALATAPGAAQPRLWVATEGALAVGSVPWPVQVGQAPAWGLARVAAIEQPQLRCSIVDLDPGDRDNSAARLLAEIAADDSESQIAHRGGRRFVARLVRQGREQAQRMPQAGHVGEIELSQRDVLADEPERPVVDPEASYLITGGCGGLGLEVAKWLASRGARHLVLTGRSAPGAAAQTVIDGLRAAGPNVTVILGDIASEADVRRLFARLSGTTPPLRGVIHAAGVLSDGVLTELTWQRFETVLAPKVRGAWLLDRLTRQHRLDFFVLFSSASAVLGAAGQANYAAANTFLDALAARRRVEGLPALSINWGPWREVGMAARPGASAGQRSADWGIAAIDPRDGVRLLELLLKKPESNVVALPAEWETVLRPFAPGSEPPLLRSIAATERQARERREASQPAGDLRARLVAAPPAERLRELRELVRERVALALGVADASRLDFSLSFAKAGLDSLMALEVRNTLSSALGLPLSPAVLFEHPSIEAVAAHLAERLAVDADAESAAVAEPTDLSSMSDEQVDEMLAKLLAESQGDR